MCSQSTSETLQGTCFALKPRYDSLRNVVRHRRILVLNSNSVSGRQKALQGQSCQRDIERLSLTNACSGTSRQCSSSIYDLNCVFRVLFFTTHRNAKNWTRFKWLNCEVRTRTQDVPVASILNRRILVELAWTAAGLCFPMVADVPARSRYCTGDRSEVLDWLRTTLLLSSLVYLSQCLSGRISSAVDIASA
jgi:hypothetical protein